MGPGPAALRASLGRHCGAAPIPAKVDGQLGRISDGAVILIDDSLSWLRLPSAPIMASSHALRCSADISRTWLTASVFGLPALASRSRLYLALSRHTRCSRQAELRDCLVRTLRCASALHAASMAAKCSGFDWQTLTVSGETLCSGPVASGRPWPHTTTRVRWTRRTAD